MTVNGQWWLSIDGYSRVIAKVKGNSELIGKLQRLPSPDAPPASRKGNGPGQAGGLLEVEHRWWEFIDLAMGQY